MSEENIGQQFNAIGRDTSAPLDARSKSMIDTEREFPTHTGNKENVIRERFDMSSTRYYQVLGALAKTDAAHQYDPAVMARHLRGVNARKGTYSARANGINITRGL